MNPRLVCLAATTLFLTCPAAAQNPGYTDPRTRFEGYAKHVAMAKQSSLKDHRWQFLGPNNISGRVTDIAAHRNKDDSYTIYVAGASSGVWKSTDSGDTFEPVFENAPSTSIGDVTVAPSNPNIVWIGTGEANIFRSSMAGCGVYKSTDAGKTFKHIGLASTHTIPRILIHPKNPDIVYVASSGHEWTHNPQRGIYRTRDGGKTWDKVFFRNEKTGVIDMVMDPSKPNTIYAATWQRTRLRWNDPRNFEGYDGSRIFKTTDGGDNWQEVTKGLPDARWCGRIGIDLCREKPNTIYAFIDNYKTDTEGPARGRDSYGRARQRGILGATIFRSDDGAKTWKQVSEHNAQMRRMCATYGWVFGQMRVDPKDADKIYVMGLALNVSRNSGESFRRMGRMHGDHHALWIDPKNPEVMVNGNDGGADMTLDGGRTWKHFRALPFVQFYNVGYDMSTQFRIYGSIQDHGSYRGIVDLSQGRDKIPAQRWTRAPGGEASTHRINPKNADIVWSCGFYGSLSRNDLSQRRRRTPPGEGEQPRRRRGRAGSTRVPLRTPDGTGRPRGQWLAPFIISPHDPNVVYHGMNYLYRATNQGKKAEIISPDLTPNKKDELGDIQYQTIWAISESPLQKDLIYVGTDDGLVHVTEDGGKSWNKIMSGIAKDRWISRMVASKYDKDLVYMAQNGKRNDDFTPYLWRSTDKGKTWKSIVANIPIGPINVIREDPKHRNVLYVGTDIGVYVSLDGARSWQVLGGLPSTFVHDLIIHPRDNILVIATHGRGMFAMDAEPIQKLGAQAIEASGRRRVKR